MTDSGNGLAGQAALVTGASSGIGRAVAEALGREGVRLVVSGRRADRVEALAAGLSDAVAMPGDMTEPGFPERVFEAALQYHGRLDIVFNNAGLHHSGTIEEIDIEKVCEMVRVNVEATFRVAYLAVKHFRRVGRGHLINTSSVMGNKVRTEAGAYCGTKFAIEALSEALRLELARSAIKVTVVQPGLTRTELHRHYPEEPWVARNIPTPLLAEDVARTVIFALRQPDHVLIPRLGIQPMDHEI